MKKYLVVIAALLAGMTAFAQWRTEVEQTVDCGSGLTIKAQAETGYHFVGWDENGNGVIDATESTANPRTLTNIQANATYTAIFEIDKLVITFLDDDAAELQKGNWDYGTTPSYSNGATPTSKSNNDHYTYTFKGWTTDGTAGTLLSELPTVTDAATYIALWDTVVNKYEIIWVNDAGTELDRQVLEYGVTPVYNGAIAQDNLQPENPAAGYTYTFAAWTPVVNPVTGTKTYTATYDRVINKFDVTVKVIGEDGSDLSSVATITIKDGTTTINGSNIEYGTDIVISYTQTDDCYEFVGWGVMTEQNGLNILSTATTYSYNVTAKLELKAVFKKKTFTITVKTADATQGLVDIE